MTWNVHASASKWRNMSNKSYWKKHDSINERKFTKKSLVQELITSFAGNWLHRPIHNKLMLFTILTLKLSTTAHNLQHQNGRKVNGVKTCVKRYSLQLVLEWPLSFLQAGCPSSSCLIYIIQQWHLKDQHKVKWDRTEMNTIRQITETTLEERRYEGFRKCWVC